MIPKTNSATRAARPKRGAAMPYLVFVASPWDKWERRALARGVAPALAAIGRAAMRDAVQRGWGARLQSLCGWGDSGRRMLRLALRNPALARERWSQLLDAGGGRRKPGTDKLF
jgi:hypothetical protein